jgi:Fic family protein
MYIPKYAITTQILKDIGLIEVAKEVISNAPLVPAYEAKFREEAKNKKVHYGTALEGNGLTEGEAKLIVDRGLVNVQEVEAAGVVARARDVQEVINYRNVVEFIEQLHGDLKYDVNLVNHVHALVVDRLVPREQSGVVRQTQVVLKNSVTGEVAFRPPEANQVLPLLTDFLAWLDSGIGRQEHPVLRAGVTHYVLTAIHPYTEGNGRTARAMATLVLFAEGYDIKRFFALEEYFDRQADEYFGALAEVSGQSPNLAGRDLTPWLAVFTRALALELTRVKERVRELTLNTAMKQKTGKQIVLSERQMKIAEYVSANGEIGMAEARGVLHMVSEDTILRDLRYLLEKGVISKKGSTKAAKYVLRKQI